MGLNVILVAVGGGIGAACRYLMGVAVGSNEALMQTIGPFPLSTLIVNVLGGFVIGILSALLSSQAADSARLFAITGFTGGFTTFSTFGLETISLMDRGAWGMAGASVAGNLVFCCIAVAAGRLLGQALVGVK